MARQRRIAGLALALLMLGFAAGCAKNMDLVRASHEAGVATTGGFWNSMIYVAATDADVIVIDLGWEGNGRELEAALDRIGATTNDVTRVFLTHSHRDHIAAWHHVRHARFHVSEAEVPYFEGRKTHRGAIPRLASIWGARRPAPGELRIESFSQDTSFVLGSDTLRAFEVPGHTPGSAAYLFRGTLFAGDALSHTRPFGFHAARRIFSDDHAHAQRSLERLWTRLEGLPVSHVCTAHAMCTEATKLMPHHPTMLPEQRAPTHPGEMLLEEFLKPHGTTQTELARRLLWHALHSESAAELDTIEPISA